MKHVLLMLFFASLAFSCRGPRTESLPLGTVSDGASYRWTSPFIPVCWENPSEATAVAQKAVEEIVVREYARVGLYFTGWGPCTPKSQGIRVFHADNSQRQVQAFGARIDGLPKGLQLNLLFQETEFYGCTGDNIIRCVEEDALHEFGHALGLRHEQSRIDSFCTLDEAAGIGEAGALPVAAYDKDSVMNYCANDLHILLTHDKPRLSDLDVETLRRYYADTESLGKDACEKDGHLWRESDLDSCCEIQSQKLLPFNARPYHYCEKNYTMRLSELSDAQLMDFLGASYESMQNANSNDLNGPWLNLELACRYQDFRPFGWEFYLEGDDLREFIQNKTFLIEMKPAADLICDGISLENSDASGHYLKTQFNWKPSYESASCIAGKFETSETPAWDIFHKKPLLMELPTLDFKPQSLVLTCDQNNYIGYFQEDGLDGPVMRFDISYNASYGTSAQLNCSRLEAFDTEIPRDAFRSYHFEQQIPTLALDQKEERIVVSLNKDPQIGARQQKPQAL